MNDQTTESPRVLAIVVTHQGQRWLEECLRGLASQVYPSFDVVVVDCASTYRVKPLVESLLPEAEFIRLERNVGFGVAANTGLEASQKAPHADYYLFIHDDTAMEPECLSLLVAAMIQTEAGIVGGKGLDWDRPELLLEVGMSADQFGYPFAGLEEGEIDQGQHDTRREVLYVSSACALVSRTLIEQSGSWDGGYFAFGEDLDLCIRARLSGFRVVVEPFAQFRHAVALARKIRETPAADRIRFYTRRNRPRTIAKNVAAYRAGIILFFYTAIAFAEMIVLAGLRRFDEIGMYPRAFLSFITTIPDLARRRRAVQKRKTEPDRRVRRYMVRDIDRARVFAERRFRDFESETLRFGTQALSSLTPAALKARFLHWIRQRSTVGYILITALLAFALRGVIFGDALGAGAIWPFPNPTGRLLGEYLSAWQDRGLGTQAAAPAAFPLLWFLSLVSFGDPRIAQTTLLSVLIILGLFGINRFVKRRTDFVPARVGAVFIYSLVPPLRLSISSGDLAALAMFAGLPFIADIVLRMLGPTPGTDGDRPATSSTGESMVRDAVRVGLIGALVVSLAPSAMIAFLFASVVFAIHSVLTGWDRREALRRSGWVAASFGLILIVLLPWSIEGLRSQGAILGPLFAGRAGGTSLGGLWRMATPSSMFYLSGDPNLLGRIAISSVLVGGLLMPGPSRRKESRQLASVWLSFALFGAIVSSAILPAPVATPVMWTIIPLFCLAAIWGHFAASLREDLPSFSLGWRHLVTGSLLVAFVAGFVIWLADVPKWNRPKPALATDSSEESHSLLSYFISTAETVGNFRVLWLGDNWVDPIRSGRGHRQGIPYLLSGPEGLTLLDLYPGPPTEGERRLNGAVDALVGRRVHLAGHLLAPMSIRFIVVRDDDDQLMAALGRQSDFALQQQQGGVAIFQNLRWLPRAVFAPNQIESSTQQEDRVDQSLMLAEWSGGRQITSRSRTKFVSSVPRTRHDLVLLGDNYSPSWKARVDGERLEHTVAFGWANRFVLPDDARGELVISFTRRWLRWGWLVVQGFIVLLAIAIARGGGSERLGRLR